MQERRSYIRYEVEGCVNLITEEDTPYTVKSDLKDIGYVGITVHANEKIEVGKDVKFELITKFGIQPVIGKGKIKNVQEIKKYGSNFYRLGIEFIDIDKVTIKDILTRILEDICEATRRKRTY